MSPTSNRIKPKLKKASKRLLGYGHKGAVKVGATFERLRDRRFCLGITGLSQSGKSTFITSLINQLINHRHASLPGFSPVLGETLLWVKRHPLEDSELDEFPYENAYRGLTGDNPRWPNSTVGVSGCLLELRLKQRPSVFSALASDEYSLYLELRDYPGEWLLDLPLRDMTFARWCSQCSAQYNQSPRLDLLGDLHHKLEQIDPLEVADETRLAELNSEFKEFLSRCKHHGRSLSLIQPGRFLLPGEVVDAEALGFIPLLNCIQYSEAQLEAAADNSYFNVCRQRYQRYVSQLVDPFYKEFFSRIDRQVVLVDIVSALNAGPDYIDDMRQALTNITDSFAYGRNNRLLQLFQPKIEKVVFAATKIDQVLSEDHEAVRQLLSVIVRQAYSNAQHQGVMPNCEATAAVRASREVDQQGERGIVGADLAGKPMGYIHPTIPSRIPEGGEWKPFLDWTIPSLNPPRGLSYQNSDPIPHIRLDSVLNLLLGDKCV